MGYSVAVEGIAVQNKGTGIDNVSIAVGTGGKCTVTLLPIVLTKNGELQVFGGLEAPVGESLCVTSSGQTHITAVGMYVTPAPSSSPQ